jgi:hypothetical protein
MQTRHKGNNTAKQTNQNQGTNQTISQQHTQADQHDKISPGTSKPDQPEGNKSTHPEDTRNEEGKQHNQPRSKPSKQTNQPDITRAEGTRITRWRGQEHQPLWQGQKAEAAQEEAGGGQGWTKLSAMRKVKGANRSKPSQATNKGKEQQTRHHKGRRNQGNKMHNKKGAGTPAPKRRTEGRSRSRRSRRRLNKAVSNETGAKSSQATNKGKEQQTRHHKGRRNQDNKMHSKKGAGTPAPKTRTEGRSRSRRSRRRTRLNKAASREKGIPTKHTPRGSSTQADQATQGRAEAAPQGGMTWAVATSQEEAGEGRRSTTRLNKAAAERRDSEGLTRCQADQINTSNKPEGRSSPRRSRRRTRLNNAVSSEKGQRG